MTAGPFGLTLFGGISLGHQIANTCQVEDPNFQRYCDQSQYDIPYYTQLKFNGSYMLPWQLSVSGTFQSYPGDARNATVDGTIAAEDPSHDVQEPHLPEPDAVAGDGAAHRPRA